MAAIVAMHRVRAHLEIGCILFENTGISFKSEIINSMAKTEHTVLL